ncbi:hypothetical protein FB45DRAFT_892889 [Roridomyces roridus]|uniref:Reverse transcriptase n=1 Tax=Roridomyces roridus TaxID=1738132 RepID=A0AAD7CFG8_9AGAR|nr:hypothetical protein FB45DRAFT_892889 [Roridomyces roridus]
MVFGPISPNPRRRPSGCLKLAGADIPWVDRHKYVGIWFTSVQRDILTLRVHYEKKEGAASYVFWRSILGCDLFVGRGRLPPTVGLQLYYAVIDCHLTHGADMILDVDNTSSNLLDDLNRMVLRRILGLGRRSGIPQLYSELGVYPLRVRRLELALRYLRYLIALPESHLARKALTESNRLRCSGSASWLGDISFVMRSLPFSSPLPVLPSLAHLSVAWCDETIKSLREATKDWVSSEIQARVSLPLLHGRREPLEDKPPRPIRMCRRHYLHRVTIPEHRHALTRLLCGSFRFRGIHKPATLVDPLSRLCRKCGLADEVPGHVFMQCLHPDTIAAREELRHGLLERCNYTLPTSNSDAQAFSLLQDLIFHWDRVIPTARFVLVVAKSWKFFGNVMPTRVCEDDPGAEDGEEEEDAGL